MYKWRGIRIRRYHKGSAIRLIFYLLLPFLIGIGGLEYYFYTQQSNYLVMSFAGGGILVVGCICVWLLLYYPFYDIYKRVIHRKRLAETIVSRKLYVEKSVTTNGKSRKKIVYFPKIYYQFRKGFIYVRFPLDLGPFQSKFLEFGSTLEEAFYCDLQEDQQEEGYICFKLLYDVSKNRLNIKDLAVENFQLPLMKTSVWDINKTPHALIAGGTGGGKTYFMLSIIYAVMGFSTMDVCDPKKADLLDLGVLPYFKDHVFFGAGIITCLERNVQQMNERYDNMKKLPNYKTGKNYSYFGLKPHFIIVDEWPAYYSALDTKERKKAMQLLNQIILIGRQSGYFLILGMQRPDAKYIDGALRDSFGLRVTLGKMSKSGYKMMFDNTIKNTL